MAIDSATSLLFAIGANTDDAEANISRFRSLFSTSISDLQNQFHGFASEITGGGEEINASFTAIAAIGAGAAAAVGAGLLEMARRTAETGEQLLLLSQQVGLSVTELSGLKVVAEEMGIDFQTLSNGVSIMDRALSPFASSGATAAKALASIGISATDAHGQLRPNVDLMADIADKFASMDDGANKTALAMSIFGRSGAQMIPILDRGGAAIRQAAAEGEKYGLVMDKDAAEKSAKFEEATRNLSMTFAGLEQEIGLRVIPIITVGLEHAVDGILGVFSNVKEELPVIEADLEILAAAAVAYAAAVGGAGVSTVGFGAILDAMAAPIAAYDALLASMSVETAYATAGISVAIGGIIEILHYWNKYVHARSGAAAADESARKSQNEAALSCARLTLAIQQVTGKMVEGNTVTERTRNALRDYAAATDSQRRAIDALTHSQHEQTASNTETVASLSTLASAYQSVETAIQSLQDGMAKPEAAARTQYERGLEAAQKQLDAYAKQIAAGKKTDETLA
ncbi:MAG TPA: hypothetical protein VFW87_01790, partial [Pirellulales bacterium]|nr:hypothetical protein [Pirellulales bacterium]